MSQNFDGDFVTIVDDDGLECSLELIANMDYNDKSYVLFLPADMDPEDENYGFIILRSEFDENNDEYFESIDDENEEEEIFEKFMALIDEEGDEEPQA